MYLSYEEYQAMGGTVDATTYMHLEFTARSVIDWYTFSRLQRESTYPEAVKMCMYQIITLLYQKQQATVVNPQQESESGTIQTAGIVHESNDGVSTTYNTLSAQEAVKTINDELQTTITMYLQNVRNSLGHRLLYRGIYPDE